MKSNRHTFNEDNASLGETSRDSYNTDNQSDTTEASADPPVDDKHSFAPVAFVIVNFIIVSFSVIVILYFVTIRQEWEGVLKETDKEDEMSVDAQYIMTLMLLLFLINVLTGIIICIIGFIGYGLSNKILYIVNLLFSGVLALLSFAYAVTSLIEMQSREPVHWLKSSLKYSLNEYKRTNSSTLLSTWNSMQRDNDCCGVDGPEDWLSLNLLIPNGCSIDPECSYDFCHIPGFMNTTVALLNITDYNLVIDDYSFFSDECIATDNGCFDILKKELHRSQVVMVVFLFVHTIFLVMSVVCAALSLPVLDERNSRNK